MVTTARAADFVSNIGIEAQINYTDSAYANISNVVSDLKYLGINLVRAATVNSAGSLQGQQHLAAAADAGIRFDFVMNGNKAVADQVAQLAAFQAKHPGSVYAVEGPNEIDHTPITYNGLTGGAAAVSFQNDLYSSVRAQSVLNGTQVYSFSLGSGATPTGGYNETSLHPYARNGSQPYATLANELKLSPTGATNVISETGYSTLPSWQSGVDQTTQAKYLLNTVFDSMKLGVQTTYLYSLLDAYADPTNTNSENHFGLFNLDNSPKTAATAIHNLTTILSDTGSNATTFTTSALDYSVSNMPSTGSSEMLEKSSGAYDIVLWNEPTIWSATTHSEVQAATVQETVNLGATYGTVKIYDPLTGASAIQQLNNVSSLTVGILDHPVIIEVSDPIADVPAEHGAVPSPPSSPGGLFVATAGNDSYTGTGIQTVAEPGYFQSFSASYTNGVETLSSAATGVDTFQSVANIKFTDGTLTFDPNSHSAEVMRLYEGILNRSPDPSGLDAWTHALDNGQTLSVVASGFINSSEFQTNTGTLSNSSYVDYLYEHILGREPDQGGFNNWVGALTSGESRADLALAFTESAEFKATTAPVLAQGLFDTDQNYQVVAALYDTFAARQPDGPGLQSWASAINSGTLTLSQVADNFANSTEFTATTAGMSHTQLVDYLYENTLKRAPDPAGEAAWAHTLDMGASVGSVLLGFAESDEHLHMIAPHINAGIDLNTW